MFKGRGRRGALLFSGRADKRTLGGCAASLQLTGGAESPHLHPECSSSQLQAGPGWGGCFWLNKGRIFVLIMK
jgi:hypothetical protein